jgi:alpha-glucuronidase
MIRYSKKKNQHKLVKEKREKEILERERKKREHLEEWEQIHAYLNSKNGVSDENTVTPCQKACSYCVNVLTL